MVPGITAESGCILRLTGVFGMIQGIVGLFDNDVYVTTDNRRNVTQQ